MTERIDLNLSMDNEQLDRLRIGRTETPPTFWKSDTLLKTVQVLAIVAGGCWVLVQFLLYERGKIELDLQKVAAEIQESEARVQLNQIKQEKEELGLAALRTYRIEYSQKIRIESSKNLDGGNSIFEIQVDRALRNSSDKEFEVSVWVADYYIGTIRQDLLEEPKFIEPLGHPGNRWNYGSATGGAITWVHVGANGAIYGQAEGNIVEHWRAQIRDVNLTTGGGYTGNLASGENLDGTSTFLVKAPADSYIGLVWSFCLERCKTNRDLYFAYSYSDLTVTPSESN